MAPNVILDTLLRIREDGASKTISGIVDGLQTAFPVVGALNQGFQLTQGLLGGITGTFRTLQQVSNQVYGQLITQNEQLNQQIIKQSAIIATNTRQLDAAGNQIQDTQTELLRLQGPLREAILELQVETRELAGVTTAQVNESFTAVLQNYNRLIGQTKRNNGDVLQSSIELTKGVVAAIGTIGLPIQQVQQEIRAILQGDLNNPDALLAKTLNISREQFNQARSQGELIDLLIGKLDAFVVANQLASRSIGNIAVNLQDFVEQVARALGEPLLDPIVDVLVKIQAGLFSIQDQAENTASVLGNDFAALLDEVGKLLVSLFEIIEPLGSLLAVELVNAIRAVTKVTTGLTSILAKSAEGYALIVKGIEQVTNALEINTQKFAVFSNFLSTLPGIGTAIQARQAVEDISQIGDVSENSFDKLIEGIEESNGKLQSNIEKVEAIQEQIASIGANDNLTEDEKNQLIQEQQKLLTQALTRRREIEKQIKRNELAIKTKNVEGNKELEIEKQKAIERAKALSGERTQVDVQPNVLPQLGTIADEVGGKLDNLRGRLESEFDLTQLNKAVDEFQKLSVTSFEAGLQSFGQTLMDLESIVGDERLTGERRLAALNEVDKLFKIQLNDNKQLLEIDKQKLTLQLQSGEVTQNEQKIGLEQIKLSEAELKLEQAKEKLRVANLSGAARNIQNAQTEILSLETEIQTLQGSIGDLEFRGLQESFQRELREAENLSRGFALDRRAELQDFVQENADTLTSIQQANSDLNQENIRDKQKLNDLARTQLETELENASTQKDIQDITDKLAKNNLESLELELELRDEINRETQLQKDLLDETFQDQQNALALERAQRAIIRQQRLGFLVQEEQNLETNLSISREDLAIQQERLDSLMELASAETTSQEDRIRFNREIQQLETNIANETLKNLQLEIKAEENLQKLRRESLDLAERNLDRTSERISLLNQAQADLQNSIGALERARGTRELDRINEGIELAKQLQNEDLTETERKELERRQKQLGGATDLAKLEKQRQDALEESLEREQQALFRKIELSNTLLRIDQQRAEIAAKIAAVEAQQGALEAQAKVLDLENQRNAAQERGDQDAVANLNQQLEIQRRIAQLSQDNAQFAAEAVDVTRLTNQVQSISQLASNIGDIEDFESRAERTARTEDLDLNLEDSPIGDALPDTTMLSELINRSISEQTVSQRRQSEILSSILGELQQANAERANDLQVPPQENITVNNTNTTPPDINSFFNLIGAS